MAIWLLQACAPSTDRSAIELGQHLFYDIRLSDDGTTACSSCHVPEHAFADNRPVSTGAHNTPGVRNAPSIVNTSQLRTLTWANPSLTTLSAQVLVPLFGETPVELGLSTSLDRVAAELADDPVYANHTLDVHTIPAALAAFVGSVNSASSPWDLDQAGEQPLSDDAQQGAWLFEDLGCTSCHPPPLFTVAATDHADPFFNTGLYNLGDGAYPRHGEGLFDITGRPQDMGRFRPPSLRNVARTAPYMHDGSASTLVVVLTDYAAGGRGQGRSNPYKDPRIAGFEISPQERDQLILFLEALTDPTLSSNTDWLPPVGL